MAIRPVVHLVGAEFKDRINQLIAQVGGINLLPSGDEELLVRDRLNQLAKALGVSELATAESTLVRAKINQLVAVANSGGGGGGALLPLDVAPSPAVAYSHRALATAKRGQALYTIREDGGNTTQTFSSDAVTGDAPSAAIATFLNGANGFATEWKDQSGNNHHVLQATAGNQPQWLASFTGGAKPALDFGLSGVRAMTTAADVSLTTGTFTCFAACLMKDNAHGDELCGMNYESATGTGWFAFEFTVTNGVSNYQYFINIADTSDGGDNLAISSRGAIPTDSGIPLNAAVVYDVKLQGNTDDTGQQVRINGAVQNLPAFAAIGPIGLIQGPFNIGSDDTVPNSSECFYGQVMELIIYDGLLSDADRLSIRQNIAAYYGVTLT